MAKNIDVAAHVKRYAQTELNDVVALIAELTKLVDERRAEVIASYKQKLAILESGEIPAEEAPAEKPKRTRGGKKVAEAE